MLRAVSYTHLSKGLVLVDAKKKTEYQIVCVGSANRISSTSLSDFAQATHEYEVAVAIQDTIKDMTGCTIPDVYKRQLQISFTFPNTTIPKSFFSPLQIILRLRMFGWLLQSREETSKFLIIL